MQHLKAGAAQSDITPPVGVDLTGYGGRPGPSTGVHDDLAAGALFLQQDGPPALILSLDLIGLHHDEVANLRRGIHVKCGIPEGRIMICCSHTHAGPATRCLRYLGNPDQDYLDWLAKVLVRTAEDARRAATPAVCGHTRVPVSVGINRRELRAGRVVIGTNESGTQTDYVDVLAVNSVGGEPIARLFSHAAHAVALGGNNTLISADWPGVARRTIEEQAPGAVGMFLQGCCGNINCREHDWEGVDTQGKTVGQAVADAAADINFSASAPVDAVSVSLELPLQEPPSAEDALAMLADLRRNLSDLPADANRGVRWMAEGAVEWAERILELAREGADGRTVPFEVQALRVGDLALVALPGEVFVEYAMAIDQASPFPQTLVAGYANGNVGYIPTEAAYAEGGYEVDTAIRYYGTTMPEPISEQLILTSASKALQTLFDRP